MGWVWGWEAEGEADWCGLFLGVMGWVEMGGDGLGCGWGMEDAADRQLA
jgi:hypothetical protein